MYNDTTMTRSSTTMSMTTKTKCELCKDKARIFCEPDHANLCWDCDARVHSANFLVARHSRNLLCHVCRSPTPWGASGPKLTPILCLCQQCVLVLRGARRNANLEGNNYNSDEGDEREVVEDNHVVPGSPPPPEEEDEEESSYGGEESAAGIGGRTVENGRSTTRLHDDVGLDRPNNKDEHLWPSRVNTKMLSSPNSRKVDEGSDHVAETGRSGPKIK